MTSAIPDRARILSTIETIVLGAAGGLLFLWANLPGGLISGAMFAVGIAAICGRPLAMPPILTQSVLLLLGITLGSLVSRQLIQHMSSYPLTIGLLALATFCSTFGSSFYLQRFYGWDQTSALLAGSPGALSQITILAAEKGADVAGIAVVQTMRVIILTAALPLLLALTGIAPSAPPNIAAIIASPLELAVLIAAAVAVALLLLLMKFPASWMFGAMIASSVLHGTDMIEGGLPPWMRGVALVGIGAVIGTRFARVKRSTLLSHVNAGLGSFAVAIVISAIFVAVIALTTNVRLADVVVAFAPGAMDAMLALALTLHIDPIFVGAHHLSRFVFVSITTPGIVHLFGQPQDDVDD
ncbi:AbrB family transcriptional regulator [Bradyrhizobium sp. AUGA SZCCT0169]|uniref:AbrB family transcriptional regulator n=1 Tax=Bradyrhizobium sp. AUGA SZCCT0169 TaxID=2807663 RepID=UPI001BA6AC47|nr:AbrB family transcriptional regulator [Bradyrhizobium sp. AUGA SZCCT0169]MBR1251882.1 AbrB family transcriptional regulator [Bradyrhizobium sp. AUGA SZCCT0169]